MTTPEQFSRSSMLRGWRATKEYVVKIAAFPLEVLKSFLNFKESDDILEKGKKTANLALRRVAYFGADYGLTFVSAGIAIATKALGFPFWGVFLSLWTFDFVVAGAFIVFFEKTGEDLSLGVDFRRAVDTIHKKSRIAGYVAVVAVIGQAIFWTGPEKIITFFRKEIRTIPRIIVVLMFLTACQSVIWGILYSSGYDFIAEWF